MVDENTLGREPITIVEIDIDFCTLTYGTSPCTASVGTTGDFKCYNTLTTCQDTENYDKGSLTLRFCTQSRYFPSPSEDELYIPIVEGVSSNPTEINISNGSNDLQPLGKRASVSIRMRDIPYNDARVDKYISDRGFDPIDKSTFWAKFLARNQYYQNRALRVRDGYIGETVSSMRTRNYVIDKINGPDSSGRVTIVAKDILKLAEDKRAQAPAASTGVLDAAITDSATSATLSPSGVGADEYPSSGKVRINNEVMSFTRSSDTLTLTRAQNNTEGAAHDEGDTVQLCLEYDDDRVDIIMEDLLTTYAGVDASYIDTTDWADEASTWLSGASFDTVITEPTGVTTLLGELSEQGGCFIWWDDVNQEIRFKAVRPVNQDTVTDITEDSNIIAESFKVTQKPDERLSQVWLYYSMVDYTESLSEASNFNVLLANVDLDKEGTDQYGEKRVAVIYSRWLTSANSAEALNVTSRKLASYSDNPKYYQFDVDAKDRALEVGDVARLTHRSIVDAQGDKTTQLVQVISREEVDAGHRIRYKTQVFGFIGRFAFVMADSANDFPDATDDEKDSGGYICTDSGLMSDGSEGYKII
jgi:hypothetical protein